MKGGGRPTRLLPYAKMLLVPITFFPLLPGRLCSGRFWLSRLFHTEKSWRTYQFTVVFVSGRQDLPSDVRAYSLNNNNNDNNNNNNNNNNKTKLYS